MPSPKLAGVRAKIDRAKYHFEQLNSAIAAWGSSIDADHSPTGQYDANRDCLTLTVHEVKPNDILWPLLIGDVVHNLRSALDHLVCQLAILRDPCIDCKKTAFPIYDKSGAFNDVANDKVKPYISPEAFALIESIQPYNAAKAQGKDPKSSNLRILSELDIIDKHRMLLVAAKYFRPTEFSYSLNRAPLVPVEFDKTWKPLKDGAIIGSIDFSANPPTREDEMYVQALTEVKIIFDETGFGCDGLQVEAALAPCIRYVEAIVDEFERKFFV